MLANIACADRNELFVNRKPCFVIRVLLSEMTRHKEKAIFNGIKIYTCTFKA